MNKVIAYWDQHGTKIIGGVTSLMALAAATPGLFPERYVPYVMFVSGAMTLLRGFVNSRNLPNAGNDSGT